MSREIMYLANLAGEAVEIPDEPHTREEHYLAKAAGQDVTTPIPKTRKESYLDKIAQGGHGGDLDPLDNPADASEILYGKEAYDDQGEKITGSLREKLLATSKDVNFYDYDGTIVYSYTTDEFLALEEFPENPSHDGLTAQGWNWTLGDAQDYVSRFGILDIGQMYITDDGRTRVYFELRGKLDVSTTLRYKRHTKFTVYWGDGEQSIFEDTKDSQSYFDATVSHTYANPGNYCIEIDVDDETDFPVCIGNEVTGMSNNSVCRLLCYSVAFQDAGPFMTAINKVNIGKNVIITNSAFADCRGLRSITIPRDAACGSRSFYNCVSLQHITLPSHSDSVHDIADAFLNASSLSSLSMSMSPYSGGVHVSSGGTFKGTKLRRITAPYECMATGLLSTGGTLQGVVFPSVTRIESMEKHYGLTHMALADAGVLVNNVFAYTALKKAVIPSGVTSIPQSCFNSCYVLEEVEIGSGVTSIMGSSFASTYSMRELHFKSSTPPTISNSVILASLPQSCVIYVPTGSLAAYTTATNYPDPTVYTYVEEG